jgi:hypothetical protein
MPILTFDLYWFAHLVVKILIKGILKQELWKENQTKNISSIRETRSFILNVRRFGFSYVRNTFWLNEDFKVRNAISDLINIHCSTVLCSNWVGFSSLSNPIKSTKKQSLEKKEIPKMRGFWIWQKALIDKDLPIEHNWFYLF